MGSSQPSRNKRDLKQAHFELFYQECVPVQYFPANQSYGYRITPQYTQKTSLPQMPSKQSELHGTKATGARLAKKAVADGSVYPYSCIGLLLVHFGSEVRCGTASLISKELVLTAASNIFDRETQQIASSVQFILNPKGQHSHVYEVAQKNMHFHEKYCQEAEGSHRYNYAFLEVASQPLSAPVKVVKTAGEQSVPGPVAGAKTSKPGLAHGYLGYFTRFTGKEPVFTFGYSSQIGEQGEMEYCLRGEKLDMLICKDSSLGYRMESFASETGSPLLVRRDDYYQVVGMHIGGAKGLSCGLQFDEAILGEVNSWVWQSEGSIELAGKQISSIEARLFAEFDWENMVLINLDCNNLGSEGLSNLTRRAWPMLRELNLSKNGIAKLVFEPSALKNLQKLYLSDNQIRTATPLAELPLLTVLKLANNKIEAFEGLYQLSHLQRLDLSSNRLKAVAPGIAKLARLKKLYLSRNQLDTFPPEIAMLRELTVLAVDRNKCRSLPTELATTLQSRNVEVILQ